MLNYTLLGELEKLAQYYAFATDITQSAGGSVSVKLDASHMAVKAAGARLSDVTSNRGFALVRHDQLKDWYETLFSHEREVTEKESNNHIMQSIVEVEGIKTLRPPSEIGYQVFLGRFVLHTHPVLVNVLTCSKEGHEIAREALGDLAEKMVWVPFAPPGLALTLECAKRIHAYREVHGVPPSVLFLANHGLVIASDTVPEAVRLHQTVLDSIRLRLSLENEYPLIRMEDAGNGKIRSRTTFIRQFIEINGVSRASFMRFALFPDQIFWLNKNIGDSPEEGKIRIDTSSGEVAYMSSYHEAKGFEEILLAWCWVMDIINRTGLTPHTLSGEEIEVMGTKD